LRKILKDVKNATLAQRAQTTTIELQRHQTGLKATDYMSLVIISSSLDTDSSLTDSMVQNGISASHNGGRNDVAASQVKRHDSTTSSGSGMDTPDIKVVEVVSLQNYHMNKS
jgi:hypothetical protein